MSEVRKLSGWLHGENVEIEYKDEGLAVTAVWCGPWNVLSLLTAKELGEVKRQVTGEPNE